MFRSARKYAVLCTCIIAFAVSAVAQGDYRVVTLTQSGTITGTIRWSGPVPRVLEFPITKDRGICDPESHKTADLERLIIGREGGVGNTVVFLKNISSGKPMIVPENRRFLDQKHCRYEPHILLVPQHSALNMKSSDATLHTVHMEGAASYNLPFPFTNQLISRDMPSSGLVTVKCNGGHVWMNAELWVIPHPYYAVTDQSGKFRMTDVPPGNYEIVAWHEGWHLAGHESSVDVLTQAKIQRPIFTEARTWEEAITVRSDETTQVEFVISNR
jgi:Polysaccharide lyase family 4, domain II